MDETPISLPLGSIDFQALHAVLSAKKRNDADIAKALEPVWPPKAEAEPIQAIPEEPTPPAQPVAPNTLSE